MVAVALFVRIEAKHDNEAAIEKFLKDGLQIVQAEPRRPPGSRYG